MDYSVVYSSRTGNTAMLAQKLRECVPGDGCVYFGGPAPEADRAELIFAGFWTDRGSCDGLMADFLRGLRGKKLFLFGTAGFGRSAAYFEEILSRVAGEAGETCAVVGTYMCQGRMPENVRKKYEAMAQSDPERAAALLENFDSALAHPDEKDLEGLELAVREALNRLQ